MATPVEFPGCNVIFVAEGCLDLPARKDENGITCCWQLEPGEVLAVAQTGRVFVSIVSQIFPPMLVQTDEVQKTS